MIAESPEERDALRNGDAGRCPSTFVIQGSFGTDITVRCIRCRWHRRGRHRANLNDGAFVKWAGHGDLASASAIELRRLTLDELRSRARGSTQDSPTG